METPQRGGLPDLQSTSCSLRQLPPAVEEQIIHVRGTVSAPTNTFPGLYRDVLQVALIWPAILRTMGPVRQPCPIRPISNIMPPWLKRRRCSVVFWTITCKAHSDRASIDALPAIELPAYSSGTSGPAGTL